MTETRTQRPGTDPDQLLPEAPPPNDATANASTTTAERVEEPDAGSVDRRSFFRVFSRQTVTTVAQVAGMAGAVQRGTAAAVVGAVGIGLGNPSTNAARLGTPVPEDEGGEPASGQLVAHDGARFRSPYRLTDEALYVLDQRLLPDRVEEIACHRAADVAFQMRTQAVNGAPLLGQLAAYGIALSAAEAVSWAASRRNAELRRAAQLLIYARPAARPVRAAVARLEARAAVAVEEGSADGDAIAAALMAEADEFATEAASHHATIARTTVDLLRPDNDAALRVLVVGDPGLLTTGQVGTGVAALQLLQQAGVALQVFVVEGRPRLEGARLATWELRLAGIEHTVVGDSAIGWLLAAERLDAVLMGADWIAANGDFVGTIGARAVAELNALGLAGTSTPLYVLAPSITVGPEPFAAGAIPAENRPGRELAAEHGAAAQRGAHIANPAVEVVPNPLVTAYITERGIHRAPFGASLPIPAGGPA